MSDVPGAPMEVVNANEELKEKKDNEKENNIAKTPEEISEKDQALKDGLDLAVLRLKESDDALHKQALDHLVSEIRSSTASMTSVPKPLKFLRPHYDTLKEVYDVWPSTHPMKLLFADVMSVLAMTMAPQGSRECLKYKFQGTKVDISSWGHEYVRSLSGEISEEYNYRADQQVVDLEAGGAGILVNEDLMVLVDDIIPFQMQHNAEVEAVDLLMEVQQVDHLLLPSSAVDKNNYERVCMYLIRCADFLSDPEELTALFSVAYTIYKRLCKFPDALRIALKMGDIDERVTELFGEDSEASYLEKKQMCYILARHRSHFVCDDEVLNDIIGNVGLSEQFQSTAADMGVADPKSPEDIYKSHLLESGGSGGKVSAPAAIDSARGNLASSFVNSFVNAGFCKDKLMTDAATGSSTNSSGTQWIYKNKDHAMISATASLGMVLLWNVEEGLNKIDMYLHNNEDYIQAGACLAMGIMSSGVRNESDPVLAVLSEYIETSTSLCVRCTSLCGLGMAYAGSHREEFSEIISPIVANTPETDPACSIVEVSLASLSLGMIYVGSANHEVASVLLQRLMECSETEMDHSMVRFLCLGLGLIYLGKGEQADLMVEAVRSIDHHTLGKYAEVTLETCAYAGSGDVLRVQHMLRLCAEHLPRNAAPAPEAAASAPATAALGGTATATPVTPAAPAAPPVMCDHQAVAVLGIALTALGENVGTEMAMRTFEHLLHYADINVKRVVPLAIAFLYTSNPDYNVIDQLSRLSHDSDVELSQAAIFGLGIVCAGTNNSRTAKLLRQLSDFYSKESNHLFVVRLAQGLNAAGKGLVTINAFHSDRLLMSGPSLAGLLTVLHACLDMKGTLLDKYHYLLFFLAPSMCPRMLLMLSEEESEGVEEGHGGLNPTPITARVGLAVETIGQAGRRPKTITGFQTHTTPVLLGYHDRAELAGAEHMALSSVLEGNVIVKKVVLSKDDQTAVQS